MGSLMVASKGKLRELHKPGSELQEAHTTLLDDYDYVARTYEQYDRQVFDYCKEGLAYFRFHPDGLPDRDTLLPLACFDSGSEHLQSAHLSLIHI